jgi:hypothetical protein
VTARLYPEQPNFDSSAERQFVEVLVEELPDEAVVIYGQRIVDRRNGEEYTADVIVGWPDVGIAVLTVLVGGRALRQVEERQSDGGLTPQQMDFAVQGRKRKTVLGDHLAHHLRRDPRSMFSDRPRMEHFVAVPGIDVPLGWSVPGIDRCRVIDRGDLPRAADRIQQALALQDHLKFPYPRPTAEQIAVMRESLLGAGIPPLGDPGDPLDTRAGPAGPS